MSLIKLDFDFKRRPTKELQKVFAVMGMASVTLKSCQISRSQHDGWHVILETVAHLPDWEIVTLQALCGSDWKRETFNYIRVKSLSLKRGWERDYWRKNWNVLFERD
jgi:hypothetical protein